MVNWRRKNRLLLVWAAGTGLLLVVLFGMQAVSGYEGGVRAAEPPTPDADHQGEVRCGAEPGPASKPVQDIWRAIEGAYHDRDLERLAVLQEEVPSYDRDRLVDLLQSLEGGGAAERARTVRPTEASAPPVGINGAACTYATIGDAIAAASDGDTIYIPSGNVYGEQLGTIEKDLTFVAALPDCSAEDPGSTSSSVTIDGGGADGGLWGGMATIALSKTVTFKHIAVQDASATYGGIFYLDPGSTLVLDNSEASEGVASSYGGGVRVYRDASLILKNESFVHRNQTTGVTGGGGGVAVYQGAVTVTGDSAIGLGNGGNSSASDGGGLYLESGSLHVRDSNILANQAADEGGGVYAFGMSLIALRGLGRIGGFSDVFSNTAGAGAGVYLAGTNASLWLTDRSGLVNNHATGNGGGAFLSAGASMDAQGTTIEGCSAGYGGGIYVDQGAITTATSIVLSGGSVVTDNAAIFGGGIYVADAGSRIIVEGSRLENNHVSQTGGGIRLFGDSRLEVGRGSTLRGNRADVSGGAVAINQGIAAMDLMTMTYNSAGGDGGALVQTGGALTITDGDIRFNSADGDGGGIYRSSGSLLLEAVTRSSYLAVNDAVRGGGLFDISGERADIRALAGPRFAINTNLATDVGGGMYVGNSGLLVGVGNLIFSTNAAASGGVAYVDDGRLELSGDPTGLSPWVGGANEATGGSGGAFHATNGSEVRLRRVFVGSVATGNSATEDGGGLYADASTIVLRDTQVVGNEAVDDGGGIYVGNGSDLRMDTSYSSPSFTSCDPRQLPAGRYCSEIRENEAGRWGAGIFVDQSTATILDTAFLDNAGLSEGTSPGDAILVSGGSVGVTNGLFSGNGANENSAVHLYTDAVYTSTHSTYAGNADSPLFVVSTAQALLAKNIMWENGDDAFYQPGASVTASCNDTENLLTGPGNISTNPHFITTTCGSYRLGPGSPAKDVCASGVNHDLDDVRRPIDADGVASPTEHDMGAFEGWIPVFLPTVLADG